VQGDNNVSYTYNTYGQLTSASDPGGGTGHIWTYGYDGATQHLTTITDPDGHVVVRNVYDGSGRVTTQYDYFNKATTYAYNSGSTVVTDPLGHAATYTFDARARILTISRTLGSTYTRTFTYDAAGNRTSATDWLGNRTDYTYDGRGNVLTKTLPAPVANGTRPTTTYVYDSKNNLTQATDRGAAVRPIGSLLHAGALVRLNHGSLLEP
jgi:YD repeat-containing protein